MPQAAKDAAMETFIRITQERHPGIVLVPLGDMGADGAVVSVAASTVIWPFAKPEDRDALIAGCATVRDDRCVD